MAEAIQSERPAGDNDQPAVPCIYRSSRRREHHLRRLESHTLTTTPYPLLDKDSAVAPDANNTSFWLDEPFHRMMLAGRATLDRSAREKIYRDALLRVRDQAPVVAIVHTSPPIVFGKDVSGFVPSPDAGLHFEILSFTGGTHD